MIAAHFPAIKTVKKVSVLLVVMLVMAVLVLVVSPRLTDRWEGRCEAPLETPLGKKLIPFCRLASSHFFLIIKLKGDFKSRI